jgi:hypothetical protein
MTEQRLRLLKYFQLREAVKRSECRRAGTIFSLTATDLWSIYAAQNGLCALTGRVLVWGGSARRDTISIDRLDPSAGYVAANVRLVTLQANIARGRWSDGELFELAKAVLQHKAACEALPKADLNKS